MLPLNVLFVDNVIYYYLLNLFIQIELDFPEQIVTELNKISTWLLKNLDDHTTFTDIYGQTRTEVYYCIFVFLISQFFLKIMVIFYVLEF